MTQDIRWHQRLDSFMQALSTLRDAVNLARSRTLSELEQQGLIQAFEFTHELAWNVIRDYFIDQGYTEIHGSKDAFRYAFKQGLISDGQDWMNSIKSRNKSSHTYNRATADEIAGDIINTYINLFETLAKTMNKRRIQK